MLPKNNPIAVIFAAAVVGYIVLRYFLSPLDFLILLNGLFAGSVVGVLITYGQLVWQTIIDRRAYNRARHMTLGFALAWIAISLAVAASIYAISRGIDNPSINELTLIARWVYIVAAYLQITAPDFGVNMLDHRNRRLLLVTLMAGLLVAAVVIWMQQYEIFFEPGGVPVEFPAPTDVPL